MKKRRMTRKQSENEVLSLHRQLGEPTKKQLYWAEHVATESLVFTSGKKCWCSVCGHEFELGKGEIGEAHLKGKVECPHCHEEGKLIDSRRKTYRDGLYFQIVTVFKGWQLIRYFYVETNSRVGQPRWWHYREVFQKWCKPGIPAVTLGHRLCAFPYSAHCPFSIWSESMKVKSRHGSGWYDEWMALRIYPRTKVLPEYRKYGVKQNETRIPASVLFSKVFTNPYTERLYKADDMAQLQEAMDNIEGVQHWWPSIKIALRHGFKIESIGNYLDYLRSLSRLGRDTRNPKFICPEDMKAAEENVRAQLHVVYERERLEQQRRYEEEERLEHERQVVAALKEQEAFAKRIAKFDKLDITDGEIEIRPLMSIQEFIDEGNAMHHCVFSNEYYKDAFSLILSARKDGERVETIEVDLHDFSIAQCYGKYNKFTDKHEQIVNLCMSGMPVIQKMSKSRRRHTAVAATA